MADNAKYFWQGFRLGFAQGCVAGGPIIALLGCFLGLFTDSHALAAYIMIGSGLILCWLGSLVIRQESREQ